MTTEQKTKVEVKVGLLSLLLGLWMTCMWLSIPFLSLTAILAYESTCENLVLRRIEYLLPTRLAVCAIFKPVE